MKLVAVAMVICVAVSSVQGAPASETTRDAGGLKAVEDHWDRALMTGETTWLATLLVDDFASVNASGVHDRAALLDIAKKNAGKSWSPPADAPVPAISIYGDTGIVRWTRPNDRGVDVFHYEGGHWHALYSQHTPLAAKP